MHPLGAVGGKDALAAARKSEFKKRKPPIR